MRRLALVPLLAVLVLAVLTGCPSQECVDYVKCQKAYDIDVEVGRYESGGECWGNLQTSQLCTAQCKEALATLAALPSPPPECTVE